MLKKTYGILGHNPKVASLAIFYLTVSEIIIPTLKLVGQF